LKVSGIDKNIFIPGAMCIKNSWGSID